MGACEPGRSSGRSAGRRIGRHGSAASRLARALAPFAVLALLACGPGTPEERLSEAREELEETRSVVEDLEEKVEEKREAVRQAEGALAKARKELEQAEGELAEARQTTRARATDVALFRAVQTALLEDEELENVAVRAEVQKGVVTLYGEVGDPALADQALETARSAAGTQQVSSEIRVRGASEAEG